MKYLKPWWSDGGSLLHLTILLSLAELRLDLDLDLYLLFPPRTLLGDELLLRNGQTSHISALSPFPASGGWGRAELLHPKCWERDPAAPPEGRLLREVRALGSPLSPASEWTRGWCTVWLQATPTGRTRCSAPQPPRLPGEWVQAWTALARLRRLAAGVRERFRVACWSPRRRRRHPRNRRLKCRTPADTRARRMRY
ncbi:nuclear factor erythroid 2-related factor 3-like [Ovis aries]|uniref:nuclear factor erythroid 2-related factor 3-like n=1 Tax=Ovis aries TaxID=9940 RepID=UPI001C2EDFB7|nr:nuclear factor erythroid 2-related factor 3-like [Ovis aries]